MFAGNKLDLILGIAMLVLGILVVTGNLYLGPIVTVVGIALIVLGVLMLMHKLPGGMLIAIVAIVLGVLLLIPDKTFGDAVRPFLEIAHLVIGVLMIVFGIMKIVGK